jgi:hypothetical protein
VIPVDKWFGTRPILISNINLTSMPCGSRATEATNPLVFYSDNCSQRNECVYTSDAGSANKGIIIKTCNFLSSCVAKEGMAITPFESSKLDRNAPKG